MIRLLLQFILLLLSLQAIAQKDSVRKYLDADLQFTTKKNAVYAAMVVKQDDHWVLHAVYPDTTVLMQVYFKDAELSTKDGPFILYHRKKIMAQKGSFKDNIPNGKWQSWYANGQLKNEGTIINNHLAGTWKSWYENGQPMNEQSFLYNEALMGPPVHQHSPAKKVESLMEDFELERILEGVSTSWYKNGNKESVVTYHNDSLAGPCSWFRENGTPSSKETYVNGKVTELECYDSTGKYTGATCSILKLPVLVHPFFSALEYIEYELHKEKNRGLEEGDTDISFTVSKKGTIEKLVFINSIGENLNKRIIHIFEGMPAWSPAIIHNQPVDYTVKLRIPYYRE